MKNSLDLNPKDFYEGSFADNKITRSRFDLKNKEIVLSIDGAETDDSDGNQVVYDNLELIIKDWWQFSLYKNSVESADLVSSDIDMLEQLDEVLIYEFLNDKLTLEGYGKLTKQWVKYVFVKPIVQLKSYKD